MRSIAALTLCVILLFVSCDLTPKDEKKKKDPVIIEPVPEPEPEPVVPSVLPQGGIFFDTSLNEGKVSGRLEVLRATDESEVNSYIIYWGTRSKEKIVTTPVCDLSSDVTTDITFDLSDDSVIPPKAEAFLIYSGNDVGEASDCFMLPFSDRYKRVFADVDPAGSSSPQDLTLFDNHLVFSAVTAANGRELWRLDASDDPALLIDSNPGQLDAVVSGIQYRDNTLYITAKNNTQFTCRVLHLSTGTGSIIAQGTNPYFMPGYPQIAANGLFLAGTDLSGDTELYFFDGVLLKRHVDIDPVLSSSPSELTLAAGSTLYFAATTSYSGRELFSMETTSPDPSLVHDILPGAYSSSPEKLTPLGAKLIFTADTMHYGRELFVTDGTPSGTVMLQDIRLGTASSEPDEFYVYNDRLYFTAHDGIHGRALWITDGSVSGTFMLCDVHTADFSDASHIEGLTGLGDTVYFSGDDGIHGKELWSTDGTSAGTSMSFDMNLTGDFAPSDFALYNGILYFSAYLPETGRELFVSGGTADRTYLLTDLVNGTAGSNPSELTVYKDKLLFAADNAQGDREIWCYYSENDMYLITPEDL